MSCPGLHGLVNKMWWLFPEGKLKLVKMGSLTEVHFSGTAYIINFVSLMNWSNSSRKLPQVFLSLTKIVIMIFRHKIWKLSPPPTLWEYYLIFHNFTDCLFVWDCISFSYSLLLFLFVSSVKGRTRLLDFTSPLWIGCISLKLLFICWLLFKLVHRNNIHFLDCYFINISHNYL